MKKIILIFCLLLIGCSNNDNANISTSTINIAFEKCAINGGLKLLKNIKSHAEFNECGYKCKQESGYLLESLQANCNNKAYFIIENKVLDK